MMDEYPSNTRIPRRSNTNDAEAQPKKAISKVVAGEVVRRKKPLGRRVVEAVIGGDSKGVFDYVLRDVLVPAARDTIADATSQGVERMLFGEARSASRRTGYRAGATISGYKPYNRYSEPTTRREEPRSISRKGRSLHDFDEIILSTRGEANEVLSSLDEMLAKYEVVTVADLYELVGIDPKYTDQKWGWIDLSDADVTRVRNGYLLNLPQPEAIPS